MISDIMIDFRLLYGLLALVSFASPDITLLVKKDKNDFNLTCVATGEETLKYALAWIPKDMSAELESARATPETTTINQDFTQEIIKQLSLESNLPPVFDQRWEDFSIFTSNIQKSTQLLSSIHNKIMHISVQFQDVACMQFQSEDKYYCAQLTKNITAGVFSICSGHCELLQSTSTDNWIPWRHYSLFKENGSFKIQEIKLGIDLAADLFRIEDINGFSNSLARWKIHNYSFGKSKLASGNPSLFVYENPILFKTSDICLTFNLYVEKQCKIKVFGETEDTKLTKLISGDYQWQHVYFQLNSVKQNLELYLSVDKSSSNESCTVAIGYSRYCESNDVRMKTLRSTDTKVACTSLADSNQIIKYTKISQLKLPADSNFSCMSISETPYCNNQVICQKSKCYCPNGFTGDWCENTCKVKFWGQQCETPCSANCLNDVCNSITGECNDGCSMGFSGPTCRQPTFSINITQLDSNSIVFVKKNINAQNAIIYADLTNCTKEPLNNYTAKDNKIYNLKPYKTYTLCYLNKKDGEHIAVSSFTTKCKGLEFRNLNITTQSNNITVQTSTHKDSCPVKEYTWMVQGINERRKLEKINNVEGLQQYTNYILVFETNISSTFVLGNRTFNEKVTTKAGKPTRIKDIKVTARNASSITFKIDDPNNMNTIGYNISYKIHQYVACNETPTEKYKLINLNNLQVSKIVVLRNLNAYTSYEILVSAVNQIGTGARESYIKDTPAEKYIANEEHLQIIRPMNNVLQFISPDCSAIKGPLKYKFIYTCMEHWCKRWTETIEMKQVSTYSIPFTELIPYSQYNLTVISMRDNISSSSSNNPRSSFTTPPQKPKAVRNFEAYAQNNSSIWLRWQSPYPPTGEPENYVIKYCKSNSCNNITTSTNECKVWTDFTCGELGNLTENHKYEITIQAKNFNVNQLGMGSGTSVTTREEASSAPEIHLKSHGNTVKVHWKHPLKPNGLLKMFSIVAQETENYSNKSLETIVKNQTILQIQRNYTYALTQLKSGAVYTISVQGFSSQPGNRSEGRNVTIPPPRPVISKAPILTRLNASLHKIELPPIGEIAENSKLYVVLVDKNKFEDKTNIQKGRSGNQLNCLNKHEIGNFSKLVTYIGPVKTTIEIPQEQHNINWNHTTDYEIHVVIENKFKGEEECIEILAVEELINQIGFNYYYLLFLLLLIPIVMVVIYILYRKGICCTDNNLKLHTSQEAVEELVLMSPSKLNIKTNSIQKDNLSAYLRDLVNNNNIDKLENEYYDVDVSSDASEIIGSDPFNKSKNRFGNVCPYDNCRVILKGDPAFSYINASYIKGRNGDRTYIATQCPKEITAYDFWRMVLQENVTTIVCLATLAEGQKKMYQYWPGENENCIVKYNDITIENQYTEICTDYRIRHLKVIRDDNERNVTQYYYISWPDQNIPIYPLSLLDLIKYMVDDRKPIVVHCSAGIGRTGAYIMCDELIQQKNNLLNIPEYLHTIRQCRTSLVAKLPQYKLIYFILDEALNGPDTALYENDFIKKFEDIDLMEVMEFIANRQYCYRLLYDILQHGSFSAEKNRIANVKPSEGMIYRPRYPIRDNLSDYINAYFVNGYEKADKYIATQHPLPNTIGDFWRLVDHEQIENIIILQDMIPGESKFWPTTSVVMKPVDFLEIKMIKKYKDNDINVYVVNILNTTTKKIHSTQIMLYTSWSPLYPIPRDVISFYYLYNNYCRADTPSDKPMLLCCHDSATGCGLFVTADLVLKKLSCENLFDIYWAVQGNKYRQKHLMEHPEQFSFIAKLAKCDIEHRSAQTDQFENINNSDTAQVQYENISGLDRNRNGNTMYAEYQKRLNKLDKKNSSFNKFDENAAKYENIPLLSNDGNNLDNARVNKLDKHSGSVNKLVQNYENDKMDRKNQNNVDGMYIDGNNSREDENLTYLNSQYNNGNFSDTQHKNANAIYENLINRR